VPENGSEHSPIRETNPYIARTETEGTHAVDGECNDLRVCERAGLSDQIAVELEVLSKSPPLLPLVAEQLGD
jgi:hypothetical protein